MVVALSYVIAVILTLALAVLLYPISAVFWILGLLGKIADRLFTFTNRVIKSLWSDIKNGDKKSEEQWVCSCGCTNNTGNFCYACGKPNMNAGNYETSGFSE